MSFKPYFALATFLAFSAIAQEGNPSAPDTAPSPAPVKDYREVIKPSDDFSLKVDEKVIATFQDGSQRGFVCSGGTYSNWTPPGVERKVSLYESITASDFIPGSNGDKIPSTVLNLRDRDMGHVFVSEKTGRILEKIEQKASRVFGRALKVSCTPRSADDNREFVRCVVVHSGNEVALTGKGDDIWSLWKSNHDAPQGGYAKATKDKGRAKLVKLCLELEDQKQCTCETKE